MNDGARCLRVAVATLLGGLTAAAIWVAALALVAAAVLGRVFRLPPWRLLRLLFSPLAGTVDPELADRVEWALDEFAQHTAKPPHRLWFNTAKPHDPQRRTHAVWLTPLQPRPLNNPGVPKREHHVRAAILVGGNCQTWADMVEEAKFLLNHGIYVLSLTLSGYPDVDEQYDGPLGRLNWTPTEASMLADGVAAMRWLTGTSWPKDGVGPHGLVMDLHGTGCGIAPHEVMVEGHSLGSCLAHLLGAWIPEMAVTVVQPLKSIGSVGGYAATNAVVDVLWAVAPVSGMRKRYVAMVHPPLRWAARAVSMLAYDGEGLEAYDRTSAVPSGEWETDDRMRLLRGFNATRAVETGCGPYCVIESAFDNLMALQTDDDPNKPFTNNFAQDLMTKAKDAGAKNGVARKVCKIRSQRAGHGTAYYHYTDSRTRYNDWLKGI